PVPVAAPPRRRAVLAIVLAGVAVTLALAAALALRKANHARHDEPAHAHDDDDDHDHDAAPPDAPPPPAPPTNDPWQSGSAAPPVNDPWSTHAGASADVAGDKLAVGEGLQLIAPPGFAVKRIGTATYLTQRDITIAAAPLAIGSNDPAELARDFARRFGLTFDRKQTLSLGGQDRPLLLFHGPVNGVAMRQAVVPLIGPSYRMAVVFQVSNRRLQRDTAANQLMVETFNQRVLVP
ncbi:MAG TPA: hypothetical protein VFP84_21395, partial [Kofleriaceae bacterium]|nr:hypothetical protein [Kofleriaceae bacterium]